MFSSNINLTQEPQMFSESGDSWLVAVVVGVLVTAIISLVVLIKFCHDRQVKHKGEQIGIKKTKQKKILGKCYGSLIYWFDDTFYHYVIYIVSITKYFRFSLFIVGFFKNIYNNEDYCIVGILKKEAMSVSRPDLLHTSLSYDKEQNSCNTKLV